MKVRILYIIHFTFLFISCSNYYVKERENFSHYSLQNSTESNTIKQVVYSYKSNIEMQTNRVIAYSVASLTKENDQSTLGNFVCDAIKFSSEIEFKNTPIDLVVINRGGLRNNLPKGEITVSSIFELMPFENELVLVTITGEKLTEGLKTIIEKRHSYFGLQLKLKGETVLESLINGQKIDSSKIYSIATSDYLLNGGDNFNFLKNPIAVKTSPLKIRDAIISYCAHLSESKKQIIPYLDGRLEFSK